MKNKITHAGLSALIVCILPAMTFLLSKLLVYFNYQASRTFERQYLIYPILIHFILGITLVIIHISMDYGKVSYFNPLLGIVVCVIATFFFFLKAPNILEYNTICIGFYFAEFVWRLIIRRKING